MPATYQEAPAKQVMYQMATERPATCPAAPEETYPAVTAGKRFPAMMPWYMLQSQPAPAPLQWKETVEAILTMRKLMLSR